jgi:hypothetical protein
MENGTVSEDGEFVRLFDVLAGSTTANLSARIMKADVVVPLTVSEARPNPET